MTSGVYDGGPEDTRGKRISLAGVVARCVSVACGVVSRGGAARVCRGLAGCVMGGGDVVATVSVERSEADCGVMSQTGAGAIGKLCIQSGGVIGSPTATHCGAERMPRVCAGIGGAYTQV